MRTAKFALAAATIIAVLSASQASAQRVTPIPCLRSTLCNGLLEVYTSGDASDAAKLGAFNGALHEKPGYNVPNVAVFPTNLNYSWDFDGAVNTYLWANGGSGFPTTTAFWLYLDAGTVGTTIMTRADTTRAGPEVKIVTGTKLRFIVRSIDNEASVLIESGTLSTSTWYYFVLGFGIAKDANGNPIGSSLYLSQNGGAKTYSSTIGFRVHQGSWQYRVGGSMTGPGPDAPSNWGFDGKLNQLAFWGRELTNSEIALLYASGGGLAYPFVTE